MKFNTTSGLLIFSERLFLGKRSSANAEMVGNQLAHQQNTRQRGVRLLKNGRAERIRTSDPRQPMPMRYQAGLVLDIHENR